MELSFIDLAAEVTLQLIIFVFVLFILNFLVFQPLLRIRAIRKQETEAKELEAKRLMERGQALVDSYDQSIKEAKAEARRKLEVASSEGGRAAKEIVAAARAEGQQRFGAKKKHLQDAQQQVVRELDQKVEKVTDDFLSAIRH